MIGGNKTDFQLMHYYISLKKPMTFLGSAHRILEKIGLEGTSRG